MQKEGQGHPGALGRYSASCSGAGVEADGAGGGRPEQAGRAPGLGAGAAGQHSLCSAEDGKEDWVPWLA